MGQIIIDIPVDEHLRFEVSTGKEYKALKKYLNSMCVLENLHLNEEMQDVLDSRKALKAFAEDGLSYSVEQLRNELNI